MIRASILDSVQSVAEAIGNFFSSLADVDLLLLVVAMAVFIAYLSMRALALYNTLRAAYPYEAIP